MPCSHRASQTQARQQSSATPAGDISWRPGMTALRGAALDAFTHHARATTDIDCLATNRRQAAVAHARPHVHRHAMPAVLLVNTAHGALLCAFTLRAAALQRLRVNHRVHRGVGAAIPPGGAGSVLAGGGLTAVSEPPEEVAGDTLVARAVCAAPEQPTRLVRGTQRGRRSEPLRCCTRVCTANAR